MCAQPQPVFASRVPAGRPDDDCPPEPLQGVAPVAGEQRREAPRVLEPACLSPWQRTPIRRASSSSRNAWVRLSGVLQLWRVERPEKLNLSQTPQRQSPLKSYLTIDTAWMLSCVRLVWQGRIVAL